MLAWQISAAEWTTEAASVCAVWLRCNESQIMSDCDQNYSLFLLGHICLWQNFMKKCQDTSMISTPCHHRSWSRGYVRNIHWETLPSGPQSPDWLTVWHCWKFLNLNWGYKLNEYGFKRLFVLLCPKGIRNTRECSFPWTKWAPPSRHFPTQTTTVRTERAPNHVWPQPRLKSEPRHIHR